MPPLKTNGGLTLIEMLVVVAIIGTIIAFGMTLDFNAFRRDAFRAENATIVSVLEKARSRSMANMFNTVHGACYDNVSKNYIIFRGSTCVPGASTSQRIPANTNIATASDFADPLKFPTIVFSKLDGKLTPQLSPANNEVDILVTDGAKTSHIKINNEGTINW